MVTPTKKKALQAKINAIKTKLAEIKDYKRVIAAEGGKPDQDDKERESKLIRLLLKHEKELGEHGAPKPPQKTGQRSSPSSRPKGKSVKKKTAKKPRKEVRG